MHKYRQVNINGVVEAEKMSSFEIWVTVDDFEQGWSVRSWRSIPLVIKYGTNGVIGYLMSLSFNSSFMERRPVL